MQNTLDKEQIYAEYAPKITRYIGCKLGDYSLVEDLVSIVFTKVYSHWEDFDSAKASISTWIYTIANNTLMDYYRTRKVSEEIPEDIVDESNPVDYDILTNEMLEALANALKLLPERERDLIVLHYYHNLTLKEVSQKLSMSYANVKIVHKKALDMLNNAMSDFK